MDPTPVNTGNRWTTVTPDDRSGILYITAFLGFTYSSLTFFTRFIIKWRVLGLDDAAICAAQVASLVQFAFLLVSLSHGVAKNVDLLSEDDYTKMALSHLGNQVALYISLGFSKISTILLIQRLFTRDMKGAWVACNLIILAAAIWTIAAAILVSVGCSPMSTVPRTSSQKCHTIIARYKTVVIIDSVTETIIVTVPGYLFWRLNMPVVRKLQVLTIFSFRLPLVVLAGLFVNHWIKSVSMDHPGRHRTRALVYQQSELCVSLIAATLPCLKGFVRSFDTGSGVKVTLTSSNDHGSSNGRTSFNVQKHRNTYQMASMSRNKIVVSCDGSRPRQDADNGVANGSPVRLISVQSQSSATRSETASEPFEVKEVARQSQEGWGDLVIRREMQWGVTSEHAHKGNSLDHPGMLHLPQ